VKGGIMREISWLKSVSRLFSGESKEDTVLFNQVGAALEGLFFESLGLFLREVALLTKVESKQGVLTFSLQTSIPLLGLRLEIEQAVVTALQKQNVMPEARVVCSMHCVVPEYEVQLRLPQISGVKQIIAVASGKGGVGKSTTAVNLALALKKEGARVGLLDADIYGPSLPMMLGVAEGMRPDMIDGQTFAPVIAHDIQSMSIGYLVDEKTPMAWRGPMATGALQQLIMQTAWNQVDYLVIDMPPGTGDIQLTLAQKVPITGAVIVTTPQDIALLDAKRAIEMFAKVSVPVLGIVENMSYHVCSNCQHTESIFGEGGGENLAHLYQVALLGSLPLAKKIREQVDGGMPTVEAEPQSEISAIYGNIARLVALQLLFVARNQEVPELIVSDD